MSLFSPTKKIVRRALLSGLALCGTLIFKAIPARLDVLNLHLIPECVGIVFGRWPIELFNLLTAGQYAPKGGGFLNFPTFPQLSFMFCLDALALYLIVCVVSYYHK